MSLFNSMKISASGLTAERMRMDVISSNISNASTTRTEDGGPYRRKIAIFKENLKGEMDGLNGKSYVGQGVKVEKIVEDNSPFNRKYEPNHPNADEEGYVTLPNVNILDEMVDLISATRAYEANVTALNASKNSYMKALEIGR